MTRVVPFAVALLSLLLVSAEKPAPQSVWTTLAVPGTWDANATGALKKRLQKYDGFAWYRCPVTLPSAWVNKPLLLHVEQVDNAHEAYFNGVKIGAAGSFPPNYKSGLADVKRYRVPAKLVKPGRNIIAIRVFDADGQGGFKGPAPTLINGQQAINLNGVWEFHTGDDITWAKGPIQVTNTGIFWRTLKTSIALKNASRVGALTPAAAAKAFTVPDDLRLEQVLAEPIVRQPVFLNFDERGRLWVMQYLQYPNPAGLKMVSKDKYWRAVYDKIPLPPPNHFKGADKITIHEDTNGDGVYDKHKTFLDGLSIATSFVRGRGGVWVLNPPYLLFYPDKNNDDIPDSPPTVHLRGFGMEDTHSVANSLRWGPDGWLYGAQGSTVSGNIEVVAGQSPALKNPTILKTAKTSKKSKKSKKRKNLKTPVIVHSMGQLIWRYHPSTHRYEIFAEGGGNAFGVEIDAKGRIYSGHNGGNTRGFHYVQGGYYRKGFTKHGPLSNPYAFGFFAAMKHPNVPRFTHNFVIYEGAALPLRYRGKLFGVEPMQGQIVQSEFFPDRSSFQTRDINRPIATSDRRFRPVDIKVGPDGAIYVADLYEPQISHKEHFSGQIDKTNGRIYRLRSKNAAAKKSGTARFDLSKKSSRELVGLLSHPNKWYRQTVLRLLADRRDASLIPLLKKQIAHSNGQTALESFWALNLSGGFDEKYALSTLKHEDPYVRLWTVRLLCDNRKVSAPTARALAGLAIREADVHVRSQLASSAKRLPAVHALPVIANLLAHAEDAADIHLPLLLWWALESKVSANSEKVLALFKNRSFWELPIVEQTLLQRIARRFALAGTRKDLLNVARLFELAPGKKQTAALMRGFELAYRGRSLAGLPAKLSQQLSQAGGGSLTFRVRQGDRKAVAAALRTIADGKQNRNKRIEYAQVFGEVNIPASVPVLLNVLGDRNDELRMTALTALQSYKDAFIGTAVVAAYAKMSPDVQSVAQTLLVSRKIWNRQFLKAIDSGRLEKKTVPLDVVRKMTIHRDNTIAQLVRKHWKSIKGATTTEMQQRIARLTTVLKSGSGDPYKGKVLFTKSCAKCHLLFGQGGRIGPDLTTYKRDDSLRILLNVVNPSAEIRAGFEMYLVVTEDGRTNTGFLFDRDNRLVILRGSDGRNITILRDNIEEMLKQRKSLMPEGLLKQFTNEQIRHLFAYLKSSQPLNN